MATVAGLGACSTPQNLQFQGVQNFRLENVGLSSSTIAADLAYYNPNNFSLRVKHIDAQVYANNEYVGSYVLDSLMDIPARANFIFPARVNINMQPILKSALSILSSKDIQLHIVGKTKVGKGGFFMNIPFDVSSSQKLNF